ncbi:MAG: hypothetical protein V7L00_16455 [Nostoc sp.]
MPGSATEVCALNTLPLNLPPNSEVYADSAYTDYTVEDNLEESSQIFLKVMPKKNSRLNDQPWNQYIKQSTRHYIETVFSGITAAFPECIHACTL